MIQVKILPHETHCSIKLILHVDETLGLVFYCACPGLHWHGVLVTALATANVSPGCAARPSVECPASIHVACLSASVSSNRVTSVSDFVYATQHTHIRRFEEPKQKNYRKELHDLKMRARLQYSATLDGRI